MKPGKYSINSIGGTNIVDITEKDIDMIKYWKKRAGLKAYGIFSIKKSK